ncbi:hypothetical protein V8G54_000922 [Vigna mungo]|uniref:RING-type E3 ubiquitin transferase n=1 Tax=Vigna mungo TaxID=3915 RepID=A0AAQ3P6B9_VIGMU
MTSTTDTFCYIDPEYQQTRMLGVKSDIYSLGIIFLQILTTKSPTCLTHHVASAIEKGTLSEMLDPSFSDWPQEDALTLRNLVEDTNLFYALGNLTNMPRDKQVSIVLLCVLFDFSKNEIVLHFLILSHGKLELTIQWLFDK